jgi:hypothetical protein
MASRMMDKLQIDRPALRKRLVLTNHFSRCFEMITLGYFRLFYFKYESTIQIQKQLTKS